MLICAPYLHCKRRMEAEKGTHAGKSSAKGLFSRRRRSRTSNLRDHGGFESRRAPSGHSVSKKSVSVRRTVEKIFSKCLTLLRDRDGNGSHTVCVGGINCAISTQTHPGVS